MLSSVDTKAGLQAKGPKTLGLDQVAKIKASGVVRGMLHRRYEKNFMLRQE